MVPAGGTRSAMGTATAVSGPVGRRMGGPYFSIRTLAPTLPATATVPVGHLSPSHWTDMSTFLLHKRANALGTIITGLIVSETSKHE